MKDMLEYRNHLIPWAINPIVIIYYFEIHVLNNSLRLTEPVIICKMKKENETKSCL